MDRDLFRFDERYYRPRRKTNYFAWAITLLLLVGFALAAWLEAITFSDSRKDPTAIAF